ncbi:MAG: hypothetical protein IT513_07510 [Burkholderiales bacterium]|nr:hypothetical protein [Burkholderiales bacterium]
MTEDTRDSTVSARYRELGAEEPPRALDDAILAASRRAVQSHPAPLVAPTGRRAWFVPLAAVAVLVLAVAVTLHMQVDQPGEEGVPAPAERAQVTAPEQSRPQARPKAAEAVRQERAPVHTARTDAPARSAAEPEARKAPRPPEPKSFAAPTAAPAARAVAPGASAPAMAPAAPAPAVAAAKSAADSSSADALAKRADTAVETPEKELERIALLRREGKHEDADKALAEFRKRYPDFRIPAPMLERVERR